MDIYNEHHQEGIQRADRHRVATLVTKKKTVRRTSTKSSAKSEPVGPSVEPDLSRPVRPYQTSDTYTVGDRIDHQSFGTGVIERVMSRSKVQVYFPEGQKMLLHGRSL